jgi:hypothetical protein
MVCQRPVTAEADFDIVRLTLAPTGRVRVVVTVVPLGAGDPAPSASGRLVLVGSKGPAEVRLDRTVRQEQRFGLCVRNRGGGVLAVHGSDRAVDVAGAATGDGARPYHDLSLGFFRASPRSVLSEVPAMFERAALFRPGFVGAWTFWLLLVAVVAGVPALLAAALRHAAGPDD